MADGNDMDKMVKVEDEEDYHKGERVNSHFVLLLKVTQASGKALLIGGFTRRAMAQMLYEIAGVNPKEVVFLTDQEVVMELNE